jgi:ribonuclease HI
MSQEKVFANGFSFKKNANAPEFVVGKMSIKADEAVEFIQENVKNGWINIDIKQAKNGNYYCELDTYQPAPKEDF